MTDSRAQGLSNRAVGLGSHSLSHSTPIANNSAMCGFSGRNAPPKKVAHGLPGIVRTRGPPTPPPPFSATRKEKRSAGHHLPSTTTHSTPPPPSPPVSHRRNPLRFPSVPSSAAPVEGESGFVASKVLERSLRAMLLTYKYLSQRGFIGATVTRFEANDDQVCAC